MSQVKQLEKMATRTERFVASGPLQNYQVFGSKGVQHIRVYDKPLNYSQMYEQDPYSQVQNFLYKRAIFGLKIYTPEELQTMHKQKKSRIQKTHKRTQNVLNLWKQELIINRTNKLFQFFFPKSPITTALTETSVPDVEFKNTLNFVDLGISKEMIVERLHKEGILPPNFYTLK